MASRNVVNVLDDDAASVVNNWLQDMDERDSEQEDESDLPLNQPRRLECNDVVSESEDDCIPSDHDSDSECSATSDDDENINTEPQNYYYGKNRHKWARIPPSRNSRTPSHNILRIPSVANAVFENGPLSSLETFLLIFNGEMINIVI